MPSPSVDSIRNLYNSPLMQLIYEAATIHRQYHNPLEVQVSTLVSVKTGGCSEDCGYCSQASRYHTDIEKNDLLPLDDVLQAAKNAKQAGSSRLCMGAAWRNVKDNEDFDKVLEMVRHVNEMGMEVCCTLGMITENQAKRLKDAGLYAYNHNIDTSESYYKEVISTRGYQDRLDTIANARKAGISVCSGGIIGMGESAEDRIAMLHTLASLFPQPESVPINGLVPVPGTPLEDAPSANIWDMVRTIATARIIMPKSQIRLSAGRKEMSREGQALCFMAGANSIFAGEKLLTTPNPEFSDDTELFDILGMKSKAPFADAPQPEVYETYKERPENPETPSWSSPGHVIEKNRLATQKAKEARKS